MTTRSCARALCGRRRGGNDRIPQEPESCGRLLAAASVGAVLAKFQTCARARAEQHGEFRPRRRAPPALHAWFSDSGGAVHRAEGEARADGRRLDGEAGAHTSTAHAANSNHMHTTTPILDHTCRRLRPPHDIMPRPTAKASCEGTPSCPTPTAGGCGWRGGLRGRLSRQVLAGPEVCTLRTRCMYTTRAPHSLCVRTHVRRLTALSVMPLPTSRRMSCSTHASSAASLPVASPNPIPNPNPRRESGPQP